MLIAKDTRCQAGHRKARSSVPRRAFLFWGLDKAGVDFVAADMPNANRLTAGIMTMVAEEERRAGELI